MITPAMLRLGVTALVIYLTYLILKSFLTQRKNTPPGPWGFPLFGALPQLVLGAESGGLRRVFQDWYYRYGPIYGMKLGVANVVVVNDFRCIKDALTHPELQKRLKFDFTAHRPGQGLITSNGQVWKEQRKFIHNYFREFGVGKGFEEIVVAEANLLTEALMTFEGKSIDIQHFVNHAIYSVATAVTFGRRYDIHDETFQNVSQKVNENMESSLLLTMLNVLLPFTKYFPFGRTKKLIDNIRDIEIFYNKVEEEHKATLDENDIGDVMDAYLLEIKNRAGSDLADAFNSDNLFWTMGELNGAGSSTTTGTVRWVFLFLLTHPEVETKLRSELDSVIGRNRLPRYSDRANLPYLEAVISETFRLGTSSGINVPHVSSSDVTFHGYHIPKGAIVLANFRALLSEPSQWKDPERFWPERFLDDEGKYVRREDFLPFGTGPRMCLGMSLARVELFIFITHIMQKMKFSVPEGQEMPSLDGIEAFTYEPKPYEVSITKCV